MEIKDKELHRITSTAIICKDGKYLLLKRSPNKKAFPGKWTVPRGGPELDEDNVEYAWVTAEEAEDYDLVEGLLEEIEMVDKIMKGQDQNKIEYKYET